MKDSTVLDFYIGKRLLITGSSGFLATNLINILKNTDCYIRRLSRHSSGPKPLNCTAHIEDSAGDISNRSVWEQALIGVDIIFHFAAQTNVHVANENPMVDLQSNVFPVLHMLETCRQKAWQPIVLYAGTATETGITSSLPVDETHPDNPVTIYDLNKLIAENYLKYYVRQGIVRGAILRLPNVYGPGPKSSNAGRGILNYMIRKALIGETLTIYGHGNYLRDYIYVEDVVRAFIEATLKIDKINGAYFFIGTGEGHTITQAANLIANRVELKTGKRADIRHIEPPSAMHPIELRNFIANPKAFIEATGWKPTYSLVEGIDQTINSYNNPTLINDRKELD
jgi:UDP-glucose 4-epimerase